MRTTLFLLFTITALTVARAENLIRLTGDVVEPGDVYGQNPLPGVKVYLREHSLEPEKWVTTDENGKFTLVVDRNDERLPGELVLYARTADGSRGGIVGPFSWDSLSDDEKWNYYRISLWYASSVTGTVVDADGNPVAGALVEHDGHGNYFAKTDEKGEFEMLLPDQGGILFASHEDFGADFVGITDQASRENPVYGRFYYDGMRISQRTPVKLALQPTKPVKIRVVTETGVPLPGIEVRPTKTILTKETEERHHVDTSQRDLKGTRLVGMETVEDAGDGEDTVRGIFVYPEAGEVSNFPQSWSGETDADGTATLGRIPESMLENMVFTVYVPECHNDGFLMPDGTRYFAASHFVRVSDEPDASADVWTYKIPRAGCLIVTVKLPDGTPIPGMWFMFDNVAEVFGTSTDENGKLWVIEDVPRSVSMYAGGDWDHAHPLMKDIDIGDGTRAKEIDCIYDGIILYGTISPPEDGVSKERLTPRTFQCGEWRWFHEEDGEYRCILPRTTGKYTISLDDSSVWNPRNEEFSETLDVKGDETEIRFDIHLKRKAEEEKAEEEKHWEGYRTHQGMI